MQLTRHTPEDHAWIQAVRPDAVRINEVDYRESLVLQVDDRPRSWPVRAVEELDRAALAPILDYGPDILLLATGRTLRFPDAALRLALLEQDIGVEIMTLDSAARTFNILASEGRRVMAALIWEAA